MYILIYFLHNCVLPDVLSCINKDDDHDNHDHDNLCLRGGDDGSVCGGGGKRGEGGEGGTRFNVSGLYPSVNRLTFVRSVRKQNLNAGLLQHHIIFAKA